MKQIFPVSAGYYWSDCGAFMGVLPYPLWQTKTILDQRQRRQLNLNLLLIQSGKRNILIDTGIGNRLSDKQEIFTSRANFSYLSLLRNWDLRIETLPM